MAGEELIEIFFRGTGRKGEIVIRAEWEGGGSSHQGKCLF